ncbi:MAG: adenosine deaminase [Gemmatimonadetes bacterium]|nr:adenosine deaminase [Gemmatimonadota bacterium]MYB60842.1 adenosine deaminase [Gemmatimonadota bacterium]
MSLYDYIAAVPKVELHVHLEGSIQPSTLLMLAERHRVDLPEDTEEGLRNWYRFRDFHHFIEVYVAITKCLRTVEDFELIVYEFGADMARQNIRYAEVTFSPSTHLWINRVDQDVWFTGLTDGRRRVKEAFGCEINWVFDLVRNDYPERGRFDYTTEVAIEGMEDGVVALGLGGMEEGYPPAPFVPWFDRARSAGLHSAPHAGEHVGPESIWGAIHDLGAERIGHGVRAIEDPELVDYLAEHRIPLEISPTSNISLGLYPDAASHPLKALHEAGVTVTVNSDDPPLFNTSLTDEACLLADPWGFSRETIDEILLNGIRYSFLPDDRKRSMETEFSNEMSALRDLAG